ncbi:hypothetical protein [Intrasporangium chromatireducens]|uniref:hypothetical protein n=1 Tax=Intrasporangium chromatireducens TaxID=1386088 RepID=UPI00138E17C4|nr:hypothetical protein [Intrasporangium chromatireducens]
MGGTTDAVRRVGAPVRSVAARGGSGLTGAMTAAAVPVTVAGRQAVVAATRAMTVRADAPPATTGAAPGASELLRATPVAAPLTSGGVATTGELRVAATGPSVTAAAPGEVPVTSGARPAVPADAASVTVRGVGERAAREVDRGTTGVGLVRTVVAGRAMSGAGLVTTVVAAPAMSGVAPATTVEAVTVTATAAVTAVGRRPRASGFAAAPPGCPRRRPVVRSRPSGRA